MTRKIHELRQKEDRGDGGRAGGGVGGGKGERGQEVGEGVLVCQKSEKARIPFPRPHQGTSSVIIFTNKCMQVQILLKQSKIY